MHTYMHICRYLERFFPTHAPAQDQPLSPPLALRSHAESKYRVIHLPFLPDAAVQWGKKRVFRSAYRWWQHPRPRREVAKSGEVRERPARASHRLSTSPPSPTTAAAAPDTAAAGGGKPGGHPAAAAPTPAPAPAPLLPASRAAPPSRPATARATARRRWRRSDRGHPPPAAAATTIATTTVAERRQRLGAVVGPQGDHRARRHCSDHRPRPRRGRQPSQRPRPRRHHCSGGGGGGGCHGAWRRAAPAAAAAADRTPRVVSPRACQRLNV